MSKRINKIILGKVEAYTWKGDTPIDNYKNKALKPARNLRTTIPRCCMTCDYHFYNDGSYCCEREGGKEGDAGEKEELYYVCDLWKQEAPRGK